MRGIVVAGLLSALMGSLAGVFNACSTLFTVDLYEKWRPGASQAQIVRTGRIATAVMVRDRARLDSRDPGRAGPLQLSAGRAGLSRAADLRRVLPRRVLEAAERPGLPLGDDRRLLLGRLPDGRRYAGDAGLAGYEQGYPQGSFLWIVNNIYFQYFSVLITIVSAIVMVVVSYLTPEPDYARPAA